MSSIAAPEPAFSPAIQAGLASGLGVTKQALGPIIENPSARAVIGSGLSQYLKRKNGK